MLTVTIFSNMELEFILRCLCACFTGLCIGYERTKHQKSAGIRTYVIVAVGSAMFTMVSKYGFVDNIGPGQRADVARVACNIVTGVSFLGAGTIFTQGDRTKGLVTSAGIWMMAAIGMAIGTGMYMIACFATLMILLVQIILFNMPIKSLQIKVPGVITVSMDDQEETLERVLNILDKSQMDIWSTHIKKNKDASLEYMFHIRMPERTDASEVVLAISNIPSVRSINM